VYVGSLAIDELQLPKLQSGATSPSDPGQQVALKLKLAEKKALSKQPEHAWQLASTAAVGHFSNVAKRAGAEGGVLVPSAQVPTAVTS
jgi:hypothetical protein